MPDLFGILGDVVFSLGLPAATIALTMTTQGALVRATVAHGEGLKAGFAESAAPGVAMAFPLFVMAILSGAAIGLGLIFLVVPGILLYVAWAVAGPALVEERLGALRALGRSVELTRGARWKVFAVALLATVASWLAGWFIGMVNVAVFRGPENLMAPFGPDPRLPYLFHAVNALFQTVNLAVWGVIQASLYIELRDWKEGPRTQALAEIFG